ncbi:hypothetical protein D3C87_2068050 [compost metagenome]
MRRTHPSVSEIPIEIGTKITFLPAMLLSACADPLPANAAQAAIRLACRVMPNFLPSLFNIVSSSVEKYR